MKKAAKKVIVQGDKVSIQNYSPTFNGKLGEVVYKDLNYYYVRIAENSDIVEVFENQLQIVKNG